MLCCHAVRTHDTKLFRVYVECLRLKNTPLQRDMWTRAEAQRYAALGESFAQTVRTCLEHERYDMMAYVVRELGSDYWDPYIICTWDGPLGVIYQCPEVCAKDV